MIKTAVSRTQPGILDRPIGAILTVPAIAAVWIFVNEYITAIIITVILILLLLGLKRPVWAMAAVIVHQTTILSYMINTPFGIKISLQLLLVLSMGLIVWRAYRQGQVNLGPNIRKLVLPVVILIALVGLSDLINSGPNVASEDVRDWLVGLMLMCFLPAVISNIRDLKILTGIALIVVTTSALIGVMQHYDILGMQSVTLVPGLASEMLGNYRIVGIAEGPLEFSYIASITITILIGILLLKGLYQNLKWQVPLILLIMAGALYFTYTRSALIAVALGGVALLFFIKTRINNALIMLAMLVVAAVLILSPLGKQVLSGRSAETQADSTISRVILWQAGINIALNNPLLGIGAENYSSESRQYQSTVDSSLIAYEKREYWGYRTLGNEPPHNDFINIWSAYGTPALIIFIIIIVLIMSNFTRAYRVSKNRFIKGLAIGFSAAIITYGINSLYHNMLATMPLLWIIAGFSLAISKPALLKNT